MNGSLHNLFEAASFLVCLFSWQRIKFSVFRFFIPFLLITVLAELLGKYYKVILHRPNVWIYNIFTPLEFLFYGFIFYSVFKRPSFKKIALYFIPLYLLCVIINEAYIQGFDKFHSNTMVIGSVCMIFLSCIYFYELIQSEEKADVLKDSMFWVSTGILFFYAGDFCYDIFFDFIVSHKLDLTRKLFQAINNNLNLFLYSCFSVGFLCQTKTTPI